MRTVPLSEAKDKLSAMVEQAERTQEIVTITRHGLRSARRGDYRVLLWIDEDDSTVVIVRVAHRADAYHSGPG